MVKVDALATVHLSSLLYKAP